MVSSGLAVGSYYVHRALPSGPLCGVGPVDTGSPTLAAQTATPQLAEVVKWALTLAVGLIGLFGSILLGIKSATLNKPTGALILLAAMASLMFSAYFGILWQVGVAEISLNQCPLVVAGDIMNLRFAAQFDFLAAGIGIVLLAIVSAIMEGQRNE